MPNVTYRELQATINDLNVLKAGSTQFEYRTVVKNASNSPEPENEGMCVMIPYNTDDGSGYSSGKASSQIYYSKTGNVYTRSYYRDHADHWGQWNKVSFGAESGVTPSGNFIKRPEDETPIRDANVLNYSGIFRTSAQNPETINLPEGVNKWGVLQHFYENKGGGSSNKTGFQLYSPIDGEGFGNLYIRAFNDAKEGFHLSDVRWIKLNLLKLSQIQDNIFTHPETTLTNIDASTPTGFYLTTEQTTGMEGVPSGKKDGVLKVTKDGDISLQRYQPSKAGCTDVYLRTISSAQPSARLGQAFTHLNEQEGHTKILDTRSVPVPSPDEYKQQAGDLGGGKGFVMYEWKFTNEVNFNPPQEEKGQRAVLCTFEPEERDVGQGQKDHTDIFQIAYFKDGGTWKRHGASGGNTWQEWKRIGGTAIGTDIDFKQWTNF